MNRNTSHNSEWRPHKDQAEAFLAQTDGSRLAKLITRHVRPEDLIQALERKPDCLKVLVPFSEI